MSLALTAAPCSVGVGVQSRAEQGMGLRQGQPRALYTQLQVVACALPAQGS